MTLELIIVIVGLLLFIAFSTAHGHFAEPELYIVSIHDRSTGHDVELVVRARSRDQAHIAGLSRIVYERGWADPVCSGVEAVI